MFKFRKKEVLPIYKVSRGSITLVKEREFLKSLEIIELTEKDLGVLNSFYPTVEVNINMLMDNFYTKVQSDVRMNSIIHKHSTIDRLKKTLRGHILQMFEGNITDSYIQYRKTVAEVHVRINLDVHLYIASFQAILASLQEFIYKEETKYENQSEYEHLLNSAINKIINFEEQLVLNSYAKEQQRILDVQNNTTQQILNEIKNLHSIAQSVENSYISLKDESEKIMEVSEICSKEFVNVLSKTNLGEEELMKHDRKITILNNNLISTQSYFENLSHSINQVESSMKNIEDITDQTKLLSLNASIEAAHAGIHGKTFAIVANEMKNLSSQTKSLSDEIESKIKLLNEDLISLKESVEDISLELKESNISLKESEVSFKNIEEAVATMDSTFGNLTNVEKSMVLSLKQLSTSISETIDSANRLELLKNTIH